MRARRLLGLLLTSSVLVGCPSDPAPDASRAADASVDTSVDASVDVPGLDAPGLRADAPGLDAFVPPGTDAPSRAVSFAPTDEIFSNPERGFYRAVDLLAERELSWLRDEHAHDSLVYSYVMLDAFRDRPIDDATLRAIDDALAVARADGFEVVLRFAYNLGPYPDSEPDAPLARVEGHIAQLAPVLGDNEDVIAVVQAGFIGAWGEWHTSTNGLDTDPAARRAVVEALLDAIPPSRSTQIRYPLYLSELAGGALDASRAWDGSFAARLGFHNDCFLSSDTDVGTYPEDEIDRWKVFVAAHSPFVPVGGETCDPSPPRSECASALAEMASHHYSFINRDYHPDIVASWESGGCMPELERRLGYRLVLVGGELPERVRPGGSFRVRLRVRNEGFAAPFNPRPVELVLGSGAAARRVTLPVELRAFLPGADHVIDVRVRVPATLSGGPHTLALALPSASRSLRGRPEFAIRLANDAVWDATRGDNVLGTVTIDDAAEGTVDPRATELSLLE
jgi:hypothetical protein